MLKKRLLLLALMLIAPAAGALRIITLAPNLTELAFAAGITPVGVSAWSDYPTQAKALPEVASWQGIQTERILLLKPDKVLAWRGGNSARQIAQLTALGLPVEWITITSLKELTAALRQLAPLSLHPEQAQQAATALDNRFSALATRYAAVTRKRLFLQFGQSPLFTSAKNTLQNEIVSLCGGENIFADSPVPWPQVSREQVLYRHPDVIVVAGNSETVKATQRYWGTQLNVPVIAIHRDWFSRPGPRIVLAAEQLCRQLHPGQDTAVRP